MKNIENRDRIIVRPNLVDGGMYGRYTYLKGMVAPGRICRAKVTRNGMLTVEEDPYEFRYGESMFFNMEDPEFDIYTDFIGDCLMKNFTCPTCGKRLLDDDCIVTSDGLRFCNEEHAEEAGYRKCKYCGEWFPRWRFHSDFGNNVFVCNKCFEDQHLTQCESCGRIFLEDNALIIDGEIFCSETCANDCGFRQCISCGEWVCREDAIISSDGESMCVTCFNRDGWAVCDDCGRFVHHTNRGRYGYYCDDCIDNHQPASCHLRGYHCGPEICFNGEYGYDEYDADRVYYGLEIETDNGEHIKDYVDNLYSVSEKESLFYMEHDGSLEDGVEIISQPMDWEHIQSFPFEKIHEVAKHYGFKSYNTRTCGLHIHFSRSPYADQGELFEAKLLYYFEKYQKQIEKIARRKYGQWCSPYPVTDDGEIPDHITLINKVRDIKCDHDDRYHAVNLTNSNTIEIRVFKGTLNENTIKASVEFVKLAADYCHTHTISEIQSDTFDDSIAGCSQRLADFINHVLKGNVIQIDDPEAGIELADA